MIFALAVFGLISAQTNQTCYFIPRDTLCGPDFTGYPALVSSTKLNEALKQAQNATSLTQACPAARQNIAKLRYQVTMICVSSVRDALDSGCKKLAGLSTTGPLFCSKQCNDALLSLTEVVNTSGCNSSSVAKDEIQEYASICQATKDNSGTQCTIGSPSEDAVCGINDLTFRFWFK